jgi:putative endonuclease
VYLARCADGTLYCGIARDVPARIAAHDAGIGARYTRGRGPLTVLAVRICRAHGTALRLEHAVKQLSRAGKLALAAEPARLAALARAVARRAQRKRAAVSQRGSGSQVRRTSRSG